MLTESKEHIDCKDKLAELTGCKKETFVTPTKRADVACSGNLYFQVKCKKDSSGKRRCDIKAIIRIKKREYVIGRLDCNDLSTRARALSICTQDHLHTRLERGSYKIL
jgi:hypothetical protein